MVVMCAIKSHFLSIFFFKGLPECSLCMPDVKKIESGMNGEVTGAGYTDK
jgi:hypothetical protein